MREQGQEFRSAEEVLAAAQANFGVDLRDRSAVHAKAQALNEAARKAGGRDYSQVERLTALFNQYDRLTGEGAAVEKKAA